MKKFALKSGGSTPSSGTNTKTGASRHEGTKPNYNGRTGLESETSLKGAPILGKGTGNSRYVSTKPGGPQEVIGSGQELRTNASRKDKGEPDEIGTTYVSTKPKGGTLR